MAASTPRYVTKTEICRLFAWSRYQFDLNARDGMPVKEAASHKGAEWKVDPAAVRRWATRREAQEAARRRRAQESDEERRREAERAAGALRAREREREARRKAERWLDRAYGRCKRCAYEDIGRPFGPRWPQDTPRWLADWPTERPGWWRPPPGLLEAVMAEPETIPFGYREPDWRRWVPPYVPGRPWPWRSAETSGIAAAEQA